MRHHNMGCFRATMLFLSLLLVLLTLTPDLVKGVPVSFGPIKISLFIIGFIGVAVAFLPFHTLEALIRQVQHRLLLKPALLLLGLVAWLFFIEVGAQIIESAQERARTQQSAPARITDPLLGFRRVPSDNNGLDANGFRNDFVPQDADIIVIGDSQTQGVNATLEESWPGVLARLSERAVYNMSVPGYGPVQYWILAQEALELSPETLVVALYFGNDFYDAYSIAYTYEAHRNLRDRTAEADLLVDTIQPQADAHKNALNAFRDSFETFPLIPKSIRSRFALYRIIAPGLQTRDTAADIAWANAFPQLGATVYAVEGVTTVIDPARRLFGLDLNEPRILEGQRITRDLLSRIHVLTENQGVELIVLLIPTKATVYAQAIEASNGGLNSVYSTLVEMETQAREDMMAFCQGLTLVCLDALPALQVAVSRNAQIYAPDADGHPYPAGYAVIADVVFATLAR